jgi:uncharacterized membrane-anchored protein YhcB (DUF1043 family)
MSLDPTISIAAVLAALAVGFLLGRRTGNAPARARELEAQLETAGKERELAQASVEAAKAEIERVTGELKGYRGEVVEHFTGTSGLLRDLTLQYRAVYDHLTKGATSLCPEGSVGLQEGLQPEKLPEGPAAEAEPSQAAAPEG